MPAFQIVGGNNRGEAKFKFLRRIWGSFLVLPLPLEKAAMQGARLPSNKKKGTPTWSAFFYKYDALMRSRLLSWAIGPCERV